MRSVLMVWTLMCLISFTGIAQTNNLAEDGEYITYHENGKKDAVFNMKAGVADGQVSFFYPSGIQKETGAFVDGKRHGKWLKWDETGKTIISEAHYAAGKKDGTWKIFDENGTLRFEMHYNKGKKIGKWIQYNEQGEVTSTKTY